MTLSKGEKLNIRVWTLFEKAGFVTKPNSSDNTEYKINMGRGRPVDLLAEVKELGVKIIGSNKSGGISGGTWTGHMNDCEKLRETISAQKCLLVATDHDLDQSDIDHANSLGMPVWNEEQLSYYEELVESIGTYAKYEIIHSLGIKTTEESDFHKVLAIKLNQPTSSCKTELYAFSMSPERLLKTSVIYRRAQGNSKAYQRMLNRNRLPKIADFLNTPDAILPTDLILHLDDCVKISQVDITNLFDANGSKITISNSNNYCPVVLEIPMKYASMEIIDGQHRLYGFTKTLQNIKKDFNLVVVGIKNLTEEQKRETFIAINDNSRRMDANLVTFLKYTTDDIVCQGDTSIMSIRVVVELNKQSPFKKSIKLLDIGKEKLTLKGLSGYDLKGLIGTKGYLRKYNPTNNADIYVRQLRIYFSIINSVFKKEWNDPDKYIIATNRGISALLKLLKSILKNENAWPSEARFKEYAKALKSNWGDWQIKKLKASYVGAKGWTDFHHDIVKAIKKDKAFSNFKE